MITIFVESGLFTHVMESETLEGVEHFYIDVDLPKNNEECPVCEGPTERIGVKSIYEPVYIPATTTVIENGMERLVIDPSRMIQAWKETGRSDWGRPYCPNCQLDWKNASDEEILVAINRKLAADRKV